MSKDKYVVIATKAHPDVARRIKRLAHKRGMSTYELIQMVLDTIVRYMDDRHNLSEDMEKAMSIFEHLEGWKDTINLADPFTDKDIGEALYILFDPAGHKKGRRAIMVERPLFGQWQQTVNVMDIFDRMVEVLLPEHYRKLKRIAEDLQCNNLVELLTLMIDAHTITQLDDAAIRQEFEDCNRSDYGFTYNSSWYGRETIDYGNKPKRGRQRSMDMFEKEAKDGTQ